MTCRICFCNEAVEVLDLGSTPLANALVDNMPREAQTYPLSIEWCPQCLNIQLSHCVSSEDLYKNYFYITPKSGSLQKHYSHLLKFLQENRYLNKNTHLLEIGSNSGELLQFFQSSVASVLGVDPAENIAEIANSRGIPTEADFFNASSAKSLSKKVGLQDLIIARHCFAHNENPSEMVEGVCEILSDNGYFVIENAYAVDTVEQNEFDQIYHEHMYYYSLHSLDALLKRNGFSLVDAMTSHIHGGSFVAVAKKISDRELHKSDGLQCLLERECDVLNLSGVMEFADRSLRIIKGLREVITEISSQGKIIYSYGATAKGNTLLNVCGLDHNQIKYCVDSTDIKQGKYLPGSEIEIISEEFCYENPPDYFLLTAWNYAEEIIKKFAEQSSAPVTFIVPFPKIRYIRKNYNDNLI